MNKNTSKQDDIRLVAMALDEAIERRDIDRIISCFSENCEIELLGVKLAGEDWFDKSSYMDV